jgi:hypothetical protein
MTYFSSSEHLHWEVPVCPCCLVRWASHPSNVWPEKKTHKHLTAASMFCPASGPQGMNSNKVWAGNWGRGQACLSRSCWCQLSHQWEHRPATSEMELSCLNMFPPEGLLPVSSQACRSLPWYTPPFPRALPDLCVDLPSTIQGSYWGEGRMQELESQTWANVDLVFPSCESAAQLLCLLLTWIKIPPILDDTCCFTWCPAFSKCSLNGVFKNKKELQIWPYNLNVLGIRKSIVNSMGIYWMPSTGWALY